MQLVLPISWLIACNGTIDNNSNSKQSKINSKLFTKTKYINLGSIFAIAWLIEELVGDKGDGQKESKSPDGTSNLLIDIIQHLLHLARLVLYVGGRLL